jgi:hypothetical protein
MASRRFRSGEVPPGLNAPAAKLAVSSVAKLFLENPCAYLEIEKGFRSSCLF